MDIRTANHDSRQLTTHGRPAMRTLALALALATLPAIGAGLDQAGVIDATTAIETTTTAETAGMASTDIAPVAAVPDAEAMATAVAEPADPVEVIPVEAPSAVATLEPGEFLWHPDVAPTGPVVVIVSLPEQRAHVYRDGLRIGVSTISSGKAGHETPTGTYPILQKRVEHYSNLYDDAPMPYMQRLTWDGVALHAGRNPGYPASHGCIRLPREFAELLYDVTSHGTTVVVADESSHSADVVWPGTKAPVDSYTGLEMPGKADVAALAQFGGHY